MEDDTSMAMEDEYVVHIQNLGGRFMLIFVRAGILACVVVVVVVGEVFLENVPSR